MNHKQWETIINCYYCIPWVILVQWCNYIHHDYMLLGLGFMRLLDLVNPRNPMILHKQWELWYSLWVDVITNLNSYLDWINTARKLVMGIFVCACEVVSRQLDHGDSELNNGFIPWWIHNLVVLLGGGAKLEEVYQLKVCLRGLCLSLAFPPLSGCHIINRSLLVTMDWTFWNQEQKSIFLMLLFSNIWPSNTKAWWIELDFGELISVKRMDNFS